MKIAWEEKAWNEYTEWLKSDRQKFKRINQLLKDIVRNGYNCIGKPEPLKENLKGYWSVRIDEKNRIVFRIAGDFVEIYQCGTHYREK